MNKNENDKIQYTAADINRYLRGDMPAAEMYEIEKAALEDPFLADAIEGYSERTALPEKMVTDDLNELRDRLKTRIEPAVKEINNTRWWRIAALLLLLAGTGSIVYKIVNTSSSQQRSVITKNEPAIQDSSPAPELKNKILPVDTNAIALNEKVDNTQARGMIDKNRELKKSVNAPTLQAPVPSVADQAATEQYAEKPSQSQNFDSANVVAGMASRSKTKEEEKAVAENNVAMRKMSPNETVNRQRALKDGATGDENALTGEQEAEPEIGFVEYDKYIEKNKNNDTSANQLHGDVVISFFVSKNGRLSNFNVEKSLSEMIDKKAISLLKKGPSWKVLKNRKAKVKYTIRF